MAYNRKGNYLESSASSLFVYFLCKAVNKGYIPVEYKAAAERGFNGLIKQFIKEEPDGSYTITNCCAVAGLGGKGNRDGSFAYVWLVWQQSGIIFMEKNPWTFDCHCGDRVVSMGEGLK